jgi:hypothetical protein
MRKELDFSIGEGTRLRKRPFNGNDTRIGDDGTKTSLVLELL